MSSYDKKLDEVLNKLNKLNDDFTKYKNTIDDIIIMNTSLVQEIANQINTKIDIMCNMENINNNTKANTTKKTKSLSKTSFFKDKMKINIKEFINILYTEDELEELYNHPDVKSKKTDLTKKNKIIDLLYNNITKKDEIKHTKLKELFDEYKKNMDNVYDSDEETKSNN
jgi:hypothetical protein